LNAGCFALLVSCSCTNAIASMVLIFAEGKVSKKL